MISENRFKLADIFTFIVHANTEVLINSNLIDKVNKVN